MTDLFEANRGRDSNSVVSDEMREMLRVARTDGPNSEQLARIASRLPLVEIPVVDSPAVSDTGRPATGLSARTLAKIGLITVATAIAALTIRTVVDDRGSDLDDTQPSPDQSVEQPSRRAVPAPRETVEPSSEPNRSALKISVNDKSDEPSSEPSNVDGKNRAKPTAKMSQRTFDIPEPDPVDEIRLLKQAQRLLVQAPARALALTEKHRRTFNPGRLEQERETIAIEALLRTGRNERAKYRSELFLQRFRDSAYCRRIQVLMNRDKK